MKSLQILNHTITAAFLFSMTLLSADTVYAQDSGSKIHVPEGVYIELTREFYESLKDRGHQGERLYSNDPSAEYLKEISISSRFMVETNLQILKQQERILQLLQTLLNEKKK